MRYFEEDGIRFERREFTCVRAKSCWRAYTFRPLIETPFDVDEKPFSNLCDVLMPSFDLMDSENLLSFNSQPKDIPSRRWTREG